MGRTARAQRAPSGRPGSSAPPGPSGLVPCGGLWQLCCACEGADPWECLPGEERPEHRASAPSRGARRARARGVDPQRLEELTRELFGLHDLNDNGLLEELELVRLNEKIALLHHGREADVNGVRSKYIQLFRADLHPDGEPVPYETFRAYTLRTMGRLDRDPEAQEMILEQFVAEARSGRQAFDFSSLASEADSPVLSAQADGHDGHGGRGDGARSNTSPAVLQHSGKLVGLDARFPPHDASSERSVHMLSLLPW